MPGGNIMNKKILPIIGLLTMSMNILSGCNSGNNSSSTNKNSNSSSDVVESSNKTSSSKISTDL